MAQVLLTVSGQIPAGIEQQIAAQRRPRADYLEMARTFDADLIDYALARQASGLFGRLLERFGGPDLVLAWACFKQRRKYRVIFTDGEQVGLPLAALFKYLGGRRRPRHLMLVHILSVPKKMLLLDRLGLQSAIDTFFVYATAQQRFIVERWQLPQQRVVFTPFMVDSQFFAPDQVVPNPLPRPMICSAGLERRDYTTMMQAVDGLSLDVVLAAASPWSKRSDTTQKQAIPANVRVQRFDQYDLRQLYADSSFVVMPLEDVDFQAGVTAILEAMAMGKAVICTRTSGQTDVVVEGETGLYVPPGDPAALRAAITYLVENPAEAARMGQAGRRRVEELMSLERYTVRLGHFVAAARVTGNGQQQTLPSSARS